MGSKSPNLFMTISKSKYHNYIPSLKSLLIFLDTVGKKIFNLNIISFPIVERISFCLIKKRLLELCIVFKV